MKPEKQTSLLIRAIGILFVALGAIATIDLIYFFATTSSYYYFNWDILLLPLGLGLLKRSTLHRKLSISFCIFTACFLLLSIIAADPYTPNNEIYYVSMSQEIATALTIILIIIELSIAAYLYKSKHADTYFTNQNYDSRVIVHIFTAFLAIALIAFLCISLIGSAE